MYQPSPVLVAAYCGECLQGQNVIHGCCREQWKDMKGHIHENSRYEDANKPIYSVYVHL